MKIRIFWSHSLTIGQLGPSFFPIFAHPGFSGFKIIDPGIPGLFRDLFLLNKTAVAVVFQVNLVTYFFHMLTKHLKSYGIYAF